MPTLSCFMHLAVGIISRRDTAQPPSPVRQGGACMAHFFRARQNFRHLGSSSRESMCSDRPGFQMAQRSCINCAPRPLKGGWQIFSPETGSREPPAIPKSFAEGSLERARAHSLAPPGFSSESTVSMPASGVTAGGRASSQWRPLKRLFR